MEGDLGKGGNHFLVQILLAMYFMKSASISPSRKTEAENKHYGTAFILCNFIYLKSIKKHFCACLFPQLFLSFDLGFKQKIHIYGSIERKALSFTCGHYPVANMVIN